MQHLLLIATGGALGAVSRYVMAAWAQQVWPGAVPVGTLLVNVIGSCAIGCVYVLIIEKQLLHSDFRELAMVGFLGAFTTFSTFSLETIQLLESGHYVQAGGYIVASFTLCIVGAGAAIFLTRAVF